MRICNTNSGRCANILYTSFQTYTDRQILGMSGTFIHLNAQTHLFALQMRIIS